MPRTHIPGVIYLLHFDPPYKHAKHYIGWTEHPDLADRIAAHLTGHGANLVSVAYNAGSSIALARTWEGDRYLERRLKNNGGAARLCPICTPGAARPCHFASAGADGLPAGGQAAA